MNLKLDKFESNNVGTWVKVWNEDYNPLNHKLVNELVLS